MSIEQAINDFWNSFGVIAFHEYSVPDERQLIEMGLQPYPRITYSLQTNDFGTPTTMTASVWDRSTSWKSTSELRDQIINRIKDGGVKINNGKIWIKTGEPNSSPLSDPDDTLKRIVINIEVEYLEV